MLKTAHEQRERILARGRAILDQEGQAILRKGMLLGSAFCELIERLLGLKGHVAITGVGKSGIIGKKISATLSSTGTPSFFIPAVEAMHGDLGMLSANDVLIALSNSGETAEILAVVAAAKNLEVPVVALTGATESSLAREACLTLDTGVEREACPLGLAPTTSTTVMLAMGDALAMVLLEERGFTREHYARFHPGGSLGQRLRYRVRDIFRTGKALPVVKESAPLSEALDEMTSRENVGVTLVTSEAGALAGIVTDGDLRRILLRRRGRGDILAEPVSRHMTPGPRTIEPEASAADALQIMEVHGITSLAVVNHRGVPEGLIHLHDILGRGKVVL